MFTILKRKKSYILPLICLFLYSAIIPMQLSDFVLCIGENGHFRFEYTNHGCSDDTPAHEHHHSEEDHCGECVDLPIFAAINTDSTIVTHAKTLTSNNSMSLISLISHKTSDLLIPSIFSLTRTPLYIDPALLSLRSVTLLI